MSKKLEDLTGKRFNNWVVLQKHDEKGRGGKTLWLCECQCKNSTQRLITTGDIKRGKPKSCGCLNKKLRLESLHKNSLNQYEFIDDLCIIIANNTKNKFYIDRDDYEKIKEYAWYETSRGYLATSIDHKTVLLHRMIMGVEDVDPKEVVVDHIYHTPDGKNDFYHNRKCDLRLTTQLNNSKNRTLPSNNTSGKIGVSWSNNEQKWKAYITVNNKRHHLGTFNTYDEAVKTRKRAEIKYFKEFQYKEIEKGE